MGCIRDVLGMTSRLIILRLTQGGARYAVLPWADMYSAFSAERQVAQLLPTTSLETREEKLRVKVLSLTSLAAHENIRSSCPNIFSDHRDASASRR